ncbi:MAG: VOC family protein [Crocinitomicaceae bacterium]|nr:VOC family protein [Crocinitomicaceae bacterium]MDC1384700.1 VOC family protein [Crocinitomicaceae bacterium]|tara:strand:- start:3757 stop:4824 length:1068 start_codon:yes stop_codon:yes gene_type:complete
MEKIICGIQQMGIGVPDVQEVWKWYRKFFGVNVRVFEEAADAPLMTRYTGDTVHSRTATLALSMEGGGGFEIWQFTSRPTEKPKFDILLGDYGLYSCRIKSRDVEASYNYFKSNSAEILGELGTTPSGEKTFFVKDPNGNIFNIVEGKGWFKNTKHPSKCGAVAGTMIGVSDINKALPLYQDILGYETIEYDETGTFGDLSGLPAGNKKVRRVLLSHKQQRKGPFARLLGPSQIELVQAIEREDCQSIFKDRFWGDWGFIHLCFDVQGMDQLQAECETKGFSFTVDSSDTFDMGEAGGRFSYIEDPDGTWIEFVETHKVPVMKKMGWYIHLKNRKPGKHLPNWMLHAMGMNKVKD